MDFSFIIENLARTLVNLTKEQQEEFAKGAGVGLGAMIANSETRVDDILFTEVVLPNLRILLDRAEEIVKEIPKPSEDS